MKFRFLAGVAALHIIAAPAAIAQAVPAAGQTADNTVTLQQLTDTIRIPYERFTLPNGLRVLVHTDRKAPVVAVSVWYDIGSKQEPRGKTGFAHLFEHLMFNGSENADANFFLPMQQVGATGVNGTTWYDRTNYYETVPTGALELALYLESDRMGHLLGAVTQKKLDTQRGVVQNEKRQGDNTPFGMVGYAQIAALFPADHPYGHDTIGSMADLDAASLDDVKSWFRAHYGPNNAVVVLAGDIDAARAKPLMEKYFGGIPRGAGATPVAAPLPTLAARKDETITDRVPTTRLYRDWVVPGLNDPDAIPLSIGAWVLGGLASSRLDNALVREEKLAVRVTAQLTRFAQMSRFEVMADVRPGVDPALVSRRLDAIIAALIEKGPTPGEVRRVVTQNAARAIKSLEPVGGKAATLAEGLLYSNDPDKYARDLKAYADATPASVRKALQKWLSRPVYALTVTPGPRAGYAEAQSVATAAPTAAESTVPAQTRIRREAAPAVGEIAALRFPAVARVRLSNGIEIVYAQRSAVPMTQVALSLDAGIAADTLDQQGGAALVTSLLKEGTVSLGSTAIAERQEELGASISAGSWRDRTFVNLSALTANLAPSLDLFSDVALHPAFAPAEVERMRGRLLAVIDEEKADPETMAERTLARALYGRSHPYARAANGTADSVKALTRHDLVAFHKAWFRPDKAKLFVVSDLPLSQLQPMFEQRFGSWRAEGTPGSKDIDTAVQTPHPHILLIDRKDSPQSQIVAGIVLDKRGTDDTLDLDAGIDVVGGSFLSRINTDIRETRGWSYGVRAGLDQARGRIVYKISAPVQADKTGAAIAAMIADHQSFLSDRGVTAEELERTQNGNIRELPGAFQTSSAVLIAMQRNDLFGRPDDYYATLAPRIRAQTAEALDAAARANLDPERLIWIVVGDADKVRPQLEVLGLSIEIAAD